MVAMVVAIRVVVAEVAVEIVIPVEAVVRVRVRVIPALILVVMPEAEVVAVMVRLAMQTLARSLFVLLNDVLMVVTG
jgi:hypothetical protein